MNATRQRAAAQASFRRWFGLALAAILIVVLAVHLAGPVKLDNPALALVAGVAAALAFSLADRLGLSKISAGGASVELESAQVAARGISEQTPKELSKIVEKYEDLFPINGARILWVDDTPEVLIPHRQVLRRLGLTVVAVSSTASAIAEIKRDPDFVVIVQDRVRQAGIEDAKALTAWIEQEGRPKNNLLAPLIVYSFDSYDATIGVSQADWITRGFGALLERILEEVRTWDERVPVLQQKSPKIANS